MLEIHLGTHENYNQCLYFPILCSFTICMNTQPDSNCISEFQSFLDKSGYDINVVCKAGVIFGVK